MLQENEVRMRIEVLIGTAILLEGVVRYVIRLRRDVEIAQQVQQLVLKRERLDNTARLLQALVVTRLLAQQEVRVNLGMLLTHVGEKRLSIVIGLKDELDSNKTAVDLIYRHFNEDSFLVIFERLQTDVG